MKCWLVLALCSPPILLGRSAEPVSNVNSRYTIDSVEIAAGAETRISRGLRNDLDRLIGRRFDSEALEDLARRIGRELRARSVHPRLARGATPDHVKVIFDVARKRVDFDVSVPRAIYSSRQNWTGEIDGAAIIGDNTLTLGVVSDGDQTIERFSGIRAAWENRNPGTERVHLRFLVETFHEQWNRATLQADPSGLYRSRLNLQPSATVTLSRSVSMTLGASFQSLEKQFPARTEASNAMTATLRYRRQMEDSGPLRHDLDAGYHLRAATRVLGSDFVYSRHHARVRYALSSGRHQIIDEVTAGLITGRAPLYERFVAGTSTLLRGWNKWEIYPAGASRVAHNTLEYRYRMLEVFYDSGVIWNAGQDATLRHSVGVGLRKSVFMLALAFPLREGHVEPTLLLGMNY